MERNFEKELETLINRYSKENASDTPDFILAEYLADCLQTFNKATRKREEWYGRKVGDGAGIVDGELRVD